MTIYRFRHPTKPEREYLWNLGEGLLYVDGKPIGLDRSTQKGELFYRYLRFRKVGSYGLVQSNEARRDITASNYNRDIFALLGVPTEERNLFIRTIHGFGYEWLPEVEVGEEGEFFKPVKTGGGTIYRFKHPTKEIVYTWNISEGLLYKNGQNPVGLDRSTNRGELLYRFLQFSIVDIFGLNANTKDYQADIIVRTYIPKIMELLDPGAVRGDFIRTIRNRGGYQWLPEVEKIENEPVKAKNLQAKEPMQVHTQKTGSPLFLDKDITNPLFSHTIDAAVLILEKTQDFVGRDFIFKEVDRFIDANDRGYFVIQGDPGIGKTALMARLVLEHHWLHHFNVRDQGITRTDLFLQNICAQLILKYNLPYGDLPPEASRNGFFLNRLLEEVSANLAEGEKAIVLVDALDEMDPGMTDSNRLFLPRSPPKGIYFVVSMRRTNDVRLRFDCAGTTFNIEHDAEDNLRDVARYIELKIELPGIDIYINNQKLDRPGFIEEMTDKSEGNFMYLCHVLPEIADGAYRKRPIQYIPAGLKSYYSDHWWRMRGLDEDAWHQYRLPVVLAMTIVREPVSFEQISQFSGVTESSHIISVLRDWRQFLHIREVRVNGKRQKRYRIYHTSYKEFLKEKDEVKEKAKEKSYKPEVDLKHAHQKIADVLINDMIEEGILEKDFDKPWSDFKTALTLADEALQHGQLQLAESLLAGTAGKDDNAEQKIEALCLQAEIEHNRGEHKRAAALFEQAASIHRHNPKQTAWLKGKNRLRYCEFLLDRSDFESARTLAHEIIQELGV